MAVPKRKQSTHRSGRRKASQKLKLPALSRCSQCGKFKKPHRTCPYCGHWKQEKKK